MTRPPLRPPTLQPSGPSPPRRPKRSTAPNGAVARRSDPVAAKEATRRAEERRVRPGRVVGLGGFAGGFHLASVRRTRFEGQVSRDYGAKASLCRTQLVRNLVTWLAALLFPIRSVSCFPSMLTVTWLQV